MILLVYSHIDRIIAGAAVPVEPLTLTAGEELRAEYFCQRRELGIINIGGAGRITVDGRACQVGFKEAMYIGMGSKEIVFVHLCDSLEKFGEKHVYVSPYIITYTGKLFHKFSLKSAQWAATRLWSPQGPGLHFSASARSASACSLVGNFDTSAEELALIRDCLEAVSLDEYDRLIRLCDALSGSEG